MAEKKTVYRVKRKGKTVLEVECESPDWLPGKPKINKKWLNSAAQNSSDIPVAQSIERCPAKAKVVGEIPTGDTISEA